MTSAVAVASDLPHRPPEWRVRRAALLGIVALCAALAVANAVELRLTSAAHAELMPWLQVLAMTGPRWVLVAGLLFLVLGLARRFPIWPLSIRGLAAHTVGFIIVAVAHAIVYTIVLQRVGPWNVAFSFPMQVEGALLRTMPVLLLLYAAALGASRLVEATLDRHARQLHASQLQAELSTARLAALRAQLHPHFLYNSLHAIGALIGDNQNGRALAATEHLADLLHAAFRDDGRDLIPFAEEMQLVERYLALQQMRFADRLVISYNVDPHTANALIPPLLLQPIVENAVQHGLASTNGPLNVWINASTRNGAITIVVDNDGPSVSKDWSADGSTGVGIPNTRGRLNTLFGSDAELRVTPRAGGGVTATVTLPLRRA